MLQPDKSNGLKRPPLVRLSKLATIDKSLVIGRIGTVSEPELEELDKKLLQTFRIHMG